MIRDHIKSNAAFTMVELLIGATLSAMIMAGVLSSYIYMGRSLARLANQQTLEAEGRRTLAYLNQDVRMASTITVTPQTAPSFYVTLAIARSGVGTTQVVYYYNSTGSAISTSISGTSISVPAHSLVRVVSTGSAVIYPIQTVLRNIVAADEGCYLRFFDAAGSAYDSGAAPYTPDFTASSSLGIKQIAFTFSTQLGTSSNGTQTKVYQVSSNRMVLRNKALLP
jgi:Tfp pilus assembly protein PilW